MSRTCLHLACRNLPRSIGLDAPLLLPVAGAVLSGIVAVGCLRPSLGPRLALPSLCLASACLLTSCRLGVAGVAMNVRLLVCRFIWDDGFGSISDALECLRLCREEGAMVSTNSWGGVPHSSESHVCC